MRSKFCVTDLQSICKKEKGAIISGPFGSNISKKFFVEKGVPVIRGNNLPLGLEKFSDEGFVFVTEKKADELRCDAFQDDLIFTAAGTIGQVGIIPKDADYIRYVISNKQLRARIDSSKVLPLFAYYWFAAPWSTKVINDNNKGSTVPLINLDVLKSLPITYPVSIKEQQKIVDLLDCITQKIKINYRIIKTLESMAKSLYDYWFVQFDFPDADDRPYKTSGGKMVWNEELGREIPAGWNVKKIKEMATVTAGGDKPEKVSIVKTEECSVPIYTNGVDKDGLYGYCDTGRIKDDSITVGARGNIGYTKFRRGGYLPIIRLISVTPKEQCYLEYLGFFLKSYPYRKNGSVQNQLPVPDVEDIKLISPDREIIEKYHTSVEVLLNKYYLLKKEIYDLHSLRDFLLPMLMNGQVTFRS